MTDAAKSPGQIFYEKWMSYWPRSENGWDILTDDQQQAIEFAVNDTIAQQAERIAWLEAELKSFRDERAMRKAWSQDALNQPITSHE